MSDEISTTTKQPPANLLWLVTAVISIWVQHTDVIDGARWLTVPLCLSVWYAVTWQAWTTAGLHCALLALAASLAWR